MLFHYFYLPTPNTISTYLMIPLSTISACCFYIQYYFYILILISTTVFHTMSCLFPVYLYSILHCTLSCRPRAYPDPSPTNSTPISMFSDMYSDVLFRSITRAFPLAYFTSITFLCRRWNLLVETPFLLSICLA
jgi:hypothetical protein